jgi:hypothetical protein
MASRRVPASLPGRPQRCPHPPQGLPRRTPQLTGADLQNRVAEPGQERSALLLALPLLRQYQQLHDQRTLRAHVRNDERTDLAVSAETMGMQRRRLQQTAQSIVGGGHERRLMLRGREEGAINRQKKAEIEPKSCGPENRRRGSAPVATRCRRPQPANRGRARDVCAHAAMPRATLDAARIVCPLHRVNDRVETRTDQVAQMTAPTVFALHVRSDSCVDDSTLTDKTRFLFLRSVISTLYWRNLATDAATSAFSLQTAPSITNHTSTSS